MKYSYSRWRGGFRSFGCDGQRGLSLVELMVSVVIGAIISAAALLALQLTQTTTKGVSDVAQLHQQAAYALRIFGAQIKQSGTLPLLEKTGDSVGVKQMQRAVGQVARPNEPAFPLFGITQADGSETLTLVANLTPMRQFSMVGGAPTVTGWTSLQVDCLGNQRILSNTADPPTKRALMTNQFFLQSNDLVCQPDNAAEGSVIMNNVAAFKVRYLVQTIQDTRRAEPLFQYNTAAQVVAAERWQAVTGVDVCLELLGPVNSMPGGLRDSTYTNCDGEAKAYGTQYRVVTRSFFEIPTLGADGKHNNYGG